MSEKPSIAHRGNARRYGRVRPLARDGALTDGMRDDPWRKPLLVVDVRAWTTARCVVHTTATWRFRNRRLFAFALAALFVEERPDMLGQFRGQEFDPDRFRIRTRNRVGGRNFRRLGVHHLSP